MPDEFEINDIDTPMEDIMEQFMEDRSKAAEDNNDVDPDDETDDVEDDYVEDDQEEEDADDEDDDDAAEEGEDDDEDGEEGDDEEGEDDDEEGEDDALTLEDDDAEVSLKIGDEVHKVTVGDLKRLQQEETTVSKQSEAIAEQRRLMDTQTQYVAQLLQGRYEKAKENFEKYKDVDLFKASRELEPDEFDALRAAKENAESEFQTLQREGQDFLQKSTAARQDLLREQAKAALPKITKEIPEWNDELYEKVRRNAVSQGMDQQVVNEIVDPGAIKIMYQAMRFQEAQAAESKVKKKVAKAPKRVAKKSDKKTDTKTSKLKAKRRQVQEGGGDVDDVAELFLANLNND